jgi:hypothetical protein
MAKSVSVGRLRKTTLAMLIGKKCKFKKKLLTLSGADGWEGYGQATEILKCALMISIGQEVRIIPVKKPGQFSEVECEPVVKMATRGDGVHRGVYLMYSIGRLDAICLRSALVLQSSEKADS